MANIVLSSPASASDFKIVLFNTRGKAEEFVKSFAEQKRKEAEGLTAATEAERKRIKSIARSIAKEKNEIDRSATDYVRGFKKALEEQVYEPRRIIVDGLDDLQKEIRAEVTAFEEREKKRVEDHQTALEELKGIVIDINANKLAEDYVSSIAEKYKKLLSRDFEEFYPRACEVSASIDRALEESRQAIIAEKERLEKERLEKIRLQKEREKEIAEKAKAEAEERARAEHEAAEKRAQEERERHEKEMTEAAERAEREKERIEKQKMEAEERARALEEAEKARLEKEAKMKKLFEEKKEELKREAVQSLCDHFPFMESEQAAEIVALISMGKIKNLMLSVWKISEDASFSKENF